MEFSGPANANPSSPGLREVQDAGLELLEPGSSIGAVMGEAGGSRRRGLLPGANSGNRPAPNRASGWVFSDTVEMDPARSAEAAAGVRDTDSILQSISRAGSKINGASSNPSKARTSKPARSFSRSDESALDMVGSGSLDAVLGGAFAVPTGDLPGVTGRSGQRGTRILSGAQVQTDPSSTAGGGVQGLRLGEIEGSRSMREMLTGLPERQSRQDRSLWRSLESRDSTRQELNPVMPRQSSLEPVLSDVARSPEAFRPSEFGLPPASPYASSASPLREMLTKINGPGTGPGSGFQGPAAGETLRNIAPRPTFELPTRKF